ncbi:MAG: DUF4339 domain-containing protein [Polyangiaceae bacterium]|nr:DUF4339 domain-containing protein [Polyangiaceae bacterium]
MIQVKAAPRPGPKAPAAWLVASGRLVVGPVSTSQLLRGVLYEKIPAGAYVAQPGWSDWRPLDEIREIRALEGAAGPARSMIDDARDFGEACLFALDVAARTTRADAAVLYRDREPYVGFMASVTRGLPAELVLGACLSRRDPSMIYAQRGRTLVGAPRASIAHQVVAGRLGGDRVRGVLMAPVVWDGRLLATLELGRHDREFRASDVGIVSEIAAALVARVDRAFSQRGS